MQIENFISNCQQLLPELQFGLPLSAYRGAARRRRMSCKSLPASSSEDPALLHLLVPASKLVAQRSDTRIARTCPVHSHCERSQGQTSS